MMIELNESTSTTTTTRVVNNNNQTQRYLLKNEIGLSRIFQYILQSK